MARSASRYSSLRFSGKLPPRCWKTESIIVSMSGFCASSASRGSRTASASTSRRVGKPRATISRCCAVERQQLHDAVLGARKGAAQAVAEARAACRGDEAVATAGHVSRQHRLHELRLLPASSMPSTRNSTRRSASACARKRARSGRRAVRGSLRDGGFKELEGAGGHVVAGDMRRRPSARDR